MCVHMYVTYVCRYTPTPPIDSYLCDGSSFEDFYTPPDPQPLAPNPLPLSYTYW